MEEPDHRVAVIGAGISGIGVGIALRRAGIEDVVILERADDLGGTWRDNVYPGVAVDVPAQAYQFSFAPNPDWSRAFARGDEVKRYVERCAQDFGIRRHIRFATDVVARTWDEDQHLWRLSLADGDQLTARFVVSATGPFLEPKAPEIPGLETFAGDTLYAARWEHGVPLDGRRVAVIGTGASAVQIVPNVARRAAHLDVYQRTPIWVGPKFDRRTPEALRRLYRRVPTVQRAVHTVSRALVELGLVTAVVHHRRLRWSTRLIMELWRRWWYPRQVPNPALRARLLPDYELGCKRPAVSNHYLRTFTEAHVELVTDPIAEVTPAGVRTTDGTLREADVLVVATGFWLASDPEPYEARPILGRDGFDLAAAYRAGSPRGYESVSIPGLPNHFMVFGPYGWTGGTWHQLVEVAAEHVVRVVREAERRGATAVEVREEPTAAWTAWAAERMRTSLWQAGDCASSRSYYFDRHGGTTFLRPERFVSARRKARSFPLDDYRYERLRVPALA